MSAVAADVPAAVADAPSTALTLVERVSRALVAPGEVELRALVAKSATITAVTNADGREQCHRARMVLKTARINIGKSLDTATEDAKAFTAAVRAKAKELVGVIEPEEDRLQALQDAFDAAREAEKQAKARVEAERINALRERVAELHGCMMLTASSGSAVIAEHIADLEAIVVDDAFQEFAAVAKETKAEGLARLRILHTGALAHEAETARLQAEREELAALRAQEDARRRAQAEREAAEKAERDALLAEIRDIENMGRTRGDGMMAALDSLEVIVINPEHFGDLYDDAVSARVAARGNLSTAIEDDQRRQHQQAFADAERREREAEAARQAEALRAEREAIEVERKRVQADRDRLDAERREHEHQAQQREAEEQARQAEVAAAKRAEERAAAEHAEAERVAREDAERIQRARETPEPRVVVVHVLAEYFNLPADVIDGWLSSYAT